MTRDIRVNEDIPAYYAVPDGAGKVPAVILIHEIWGLVGHIKDVADRLAAQGYAVLAPDLLTGVALAGKVDQSIWKEMMDPATRDEAQKKMRAALAPTMSPEFGRATLDKLRSCLDFLSADDATDGRVAAVGFCFGGSYCFALAAEEPRLKATVPFYGRPPDAAQIAAIGCPVFAFYGEKDAALIASLPALVEAMAREGKQFSHVVYPGTGHAFFNDTNANTYNKAAADDAWVKMLAFLRRHLRGVAE